MSYRETQTMNGSNTYLVYSLLLGWSISAWLIYDEKTTDYMIHHYLLVCFKTDGFNNNYT